MRTHANSFQWRTAQAKPALLGPWVGDFGGGTIRAPPAGDPSPRLDDRNGRRPLEKFNEGLGCVGLLGTGRDRRREHNSLLEFGGKRTGDIKTGGRQDIDEKKAEFGVAFGNG